MSLQLLEFQKTHTSYGGVQSTIVVKIENLEKVLGQCGDLPLCIISICGPSRQGKSFILSHMIRCFEATQKKIPDWMDWGNPKKAVDKGFTWRNAYGPATQGIWIWEKPFILKSSDGKECAVLLIDTQGTYDEFTSYRDMEATVGLSMLMSSVMIFNFFTNLKEDIISSLITYINYGLLALDGKDSEKPFQKIKFLIRDWNNPSEYPYGKLGGKDFIKKKMEVWENQPQSARKVRETISNCFQEMDCFLMPPIGDKALARDYDGNIGALNKMFAKKMEQFITELSTDEIVIKKIAGTEVTAKDLRKYIDMYVKTFNSSIIPSTMSLWEVITLVANTNTVENAQKMYHNKMDLHGRGKKYLNPESLAKAQESAKKDSLEFFKTAKKYGRNIDTFQHTLEQYIAKEAKVYEAENEAKRTKILQFAEKAAKEGFDDFLHPNSHSEVRTTFMRGAIFIHWVILHKL